MAKLGVSSKSQASLDQSVGVLLDGRILGYCSPSQAKTIADTLRYWKVEQSHNVPLELEIGYVPNSQGGCYPGVYLMSQASRMYRALKYLPLGKLVSRSMIRMHVTPILTSSRIMLGRSSSLG